jgi:hypothetical protein
MLFARVAYRYSSACNFEIATGGILMRAAGSWSIAAVCCACLSSAHGAPILVDPTGDTFGAGAVKHDITTIDATVNTSLNQTTLTINFAGAISPASAFAANSLTGFIDLDTDQNAATGGQASFGGSLAGGNSWINNSIPPNGTGVPGPLVALGDEFFVDLFSEFVHPGLVNIQNTFTSAVAFTVPIQYGPTSITVTLPFVGAGPGGAMNIGVLAGTFAEVTDRAPNGATPASTPAGGVTQVPEPSSLLLVLAAALCAAPVWRRWPDAVYVSRSFLRK